MISKKIISVEDSNGGYSGFFEDRPDILAEGDTYTEFVDNLKNLRKSVKKFEGRFKNSKKLKSIKETFGGLKKILKNKKK